MLRSGGGGGGEGNTILGEAKALPCMHPQSLYFRFTAIATCIYYLHVSDHICICG